MSRRSTKQTKDKHSAAQQVFNGGELSGSGAMPLILLSMISYLTVGQSEGGRGRQKSTEPPTRTSQCLFSVEKTPFILIFWKNYIEQKVNAYLQRTESEQRDL